MQIYLIAAIILPAALCRQFSVPPGHNKSRIWELIWKHYSRMTPVPPNFNITLPPPILMKESESVFDGIRNIDIQSLKSALTSPVQIGGTLRPLFTEEEMTQTVSDLDFVRQKVAELQNRNLVPEELGSPLYSDILADQDLAAAMAEKFRNSSERKKRALVSDEFRMWPNTSIYYQFGTPEVTAEVKSNLALVFGYYNQHTCLNYLEFNGSVPAEAYGRYLYISDQDTGSSGACFASLGMRTGAGDVPTPVNLDPQCTSLGTVLHEIAHSLGLFHEQSRLDRDTYVTIETGNIEPGKEDQFDLCNLVLPCRAHDYPYDYGSVMHYGQQYFLKSTLTNPPDRTITTKDAEYQATIGSRDFALSFYDLKLINTAYCGVAPSTGFQYTNSPCNGVTNPCQNQGYLNPGNAACNECLCPEPYSSSSNCVSRKTGSPSACGADLSGSGTVQSITNPAFQDNMECVWMITCPAGQVISYSFPTFCFSQFNTANGPATFCSSTLYLEIRKDNLINTGPRFCGCSSTSGVLTTPSAGTSSSNTLILILKEISTYDTLGITFQMDYQCIAASSTTSLTTSTGPTTKHPTTTTSHTTSHTITTSGHHTTKHSTSTTGHNTTKHSTTTSGVQTTKHLTTTSGVQTAKHSTITSGVQTTKQPTTTSGVQTTKHPTTTSGVQTTKHPTTTSGVQTTKHSTTSTGPNTTKHPTTTSGVQTTKHPTTTSGVQTTKHPTTSTGQNTTKHPTTTSGVQTTKHPTTTSGVQTTKHPTTTSGVQTTRHTTTTSGPHTTKHPTTTSGTNTTKHTMTTSGAQTTRHSTTTSGVQTTKHPTTTSGVQTTRHTTITSGVQTTRHSTTTSGPHTTKHPTTTSGTNTTKHTMTTSRAQTTRHSTTTSGVRTTKHSTTIGGVQTTKPPTTTATTSGLHTTKHPTTTTSGATKTSSGSPTTEHKTTTSVLHTTKQPTATTSGLHTTRPATTTSGAPTSKHITTTTDAQTTKQPTTTTSGLPSTTKHPTTSITVAATTGACTHACTDSPLAEHNCGNVTPEMCSGRPGKYAVQCPKTCNNCDGCNCANSNRMNDAACNTYYGLGYCSRYAVIRDYCPQACGTCTSCNSNGGCTTTKPAAIATTTTTTITITAKPTAPATTANSCSDTISGCTLQQCNRKPGYFYPQCKKTCNNCGANSVCVDSTVLNCNAYGTLYCKYGNFASYCPKMCGSCSTATAAPAATTTTANSCADSISGCTVQKCDRAPGQYLSVCKKTCNNCAGTACYDSQLTNCAAYVNYCSTYATLKLYCPKACGVC